MLGWSLTVEHDGETYYHVDHTLDLTLSKRIAEVAEEVVDMSYLYEHVDPAYKVWWPHCGYPNTYKVRNDKLQAAMADHAPYAKPVPEPEKLRTLPDDVVVQAILWDQS